MIGALSGTVFFTTNDSLILMVGGVGYTVALPAERLASLSVGKHIELFIFTHVREDTLQLYGFTTQREHALFQLLLSVSGIGPKTALHIVDHGVAKIESAIARADVAFFTTIPRVGTKNAQKIIIELKSKLGGMNNLDLQGIHGETQELLDALVGMGFTKNEALEAIRKLPAKLKTLEEKVKFALRSLGKPT